MFIITGTTGVVALQAGCTFIGTEIDPVCCSAAEDRLNIVVDKIDEGVDSESDGLTTYYRNQGGLLLAST